jgi:hypothetical protein
MPCQFGNKSAHHCHLGNAFARASHKQGSGNGQALCYEIGELKLERATRFELATKSLGSSYSTN